MPVSRAGAVTELDDAAIAIAVRAEQIRLLYRPSAVIYANIVVAVGVAVVVRPLYPTWQLALWLGLLSIVVMARRFLRSRYLRSARGAGAARRWGRYFALGAFATGCTWGFTCSIVLMLSQPTPPIFIEFVLGGMMAGGIVSNAVYLPALLGFMLPAVLPTIAVLLTRPAVSEVEMGLMLAAFSIVLTMVGRNINYSIVGGLRLRAAQDSLLARLRTSEAAMAEAQAIAHVGSWDFDLVTNTVMWSPEAFRIFGADPAAIKPSYEAMLSRVHPDDKVQVAKVYAGLIPAHMLAGTDYRIVMDGGAVKWIHESARAVHGADGHAIRLMGIMQDITERKEGELSRALLASIVDSSHDAIVAETLAGAITSWNRSAEKLYGYSADEIVGKNVRLLIPQGRHDEIEDNLTALAKGGRIAPFDTERLAKDGTLVPVSIAVSPIRDGAGKVVGGSFIGRDITERKLALEVLAYGDRLAHAVTIGTGILVKARSIQEGMPEALRTVGEGLKVDRVLVMQQLRTPAQTVVFRYVWQAPEVRTPFDLSVSPVAGVDPVAVAAVHDQLSEGTPWIGQLATSTGAVRANLDRFHIQSTVMVPIFAGDILWGNLGIDSCRAVRDWTASEIDTLRTFGDMLGALILRDQAHLLLETSETRFRVMTTAAQDAIVTIDGSGLIGHWNRSAERILGYSAQEAIGRPVHDFIVPARFKERAALGLDIFLATGAGVMLGKTVELAALRKDGTEIAIEVSLAGAQIGGSWQAMAILRDITDRKIAEGKIQYANILLKAEMEASPDGILIVDENRKIVSFNLRMAEIWKIPAGKLVSGNDAAVLDEVIAAVRNPDAFAARVRHLYDHPGETSQDELATTDGRFIDRHTVTLNGATGRYLGRVWFFRDITPRKTAEALALRMARYDVLTGLANRAVFVEGLKHAIAQANRGGKGFAVIYLDLDHFKDVNDTLGHPVGDRLLMAVADRLRANTREVDTVSRFGGDEFAVVGANIGEPSEAGVFAAKLLKSISEPFSVEGNDIHTGASIGIDLYGPDSADAETLLSHADVALYRAKSEGRGGYRFFTEAMDAEVRLRVTLGAELREALVAGQLFLLYQPQVAIDTGRVIGLEALVRWRHPQRGILGPDVFVPIAEKVGIVAKLGYWVLQTACRQANAWIDAAITPVRTAVNVSSLQFKTPFGLENDVTEVLKETGLPPQLLELELTESVLMDASREHAETLARLHRIGITIAIDDFGTGYSSLDYLRRFPVDRIKIAQNFVEQLVTMPGDAAIVKATLGLARELGIAVIAEGVETAEQLALLKGWGCGEIQGFYFAKPLAAEDVTRLLRNGGILIPKDACARAAGTVVDGSRRLVIGRS